MIKGADIGFSYVDMADIRWTRIECDCGEDECWKMEVLPREHE